MKQVTKVIVLITVLGFGATEALAQRGITWRGGGGWGPGTPYVRLYNPQTVEAISGEIVAVDRFTPARGMYHGVHLTVKTRRRSPYISARHGTSKTKT